MDFLQHFFPTEGNAFLGQFQLCGQALNKAMDFSAAPYHKGSAYGGTAVQFLDFARNVLRQLLYQRVHQLPYLFRRYRMAKHHYVLVFNLLFRGGAYLDVLCRLKIHQEMLHQHLCNLIPGAGNHAISNNTAVTGNRNVAGARPHIHQGDIQHAESLGNGYADGRNRLQGKACHLQPRQLHRGVQPFHYILWQESHNDILADGLRLVTFQVGQGIAVQIIFDNGISHTVKLEVCIIALI